MSRAARALFDALTCDKDYIEFRRSDGAGEHCEGGARTQFTSAPSTGSIPRLR
jgi:hypothetical protein